MYHIQSECGWFFNILVLAYVAYIVCTRTCHTYVFSSILIEIKRKIYIICICTCYDISLPLQTSKINLPLLQKHMNPFCWNFQDRYCYKEKFGMSRISIWIQFFCPLPYFLSSRYAAGWSLNSVLHKNKGHKIMFTFGRDMDGYCHFMITQSQLHTFIIKTTLHNYRCWYYSIEIVEDCAKYFLVCFYSILGIGI